MEKTFAGLVSEVEKAVLPLGFRIDDAKRIEKTTLNMGGSETRVDDGEIRITIVYKGTVG